MTHETIQERLSEWLDGELDASMSAAVEAHVDACPACRRETELLRRLGPALFRAPAPADPRATEAFVARVLARVEEDEISLWERFAGRWLAPAFGLALAVQLAFILQPAQDNDLPLDAQLLSDGRGALPSYDDILEVEP